MEHDEKSCWVKVFGSAIIRVAPDTATIVVNVSCVEEKPQAAFTAAREGAQSVSAYLHKTGVTDYGSSQVTLSPEFHFASGEQKFLGYRATIVFNIILHELEILETLLVGVIEAGANQLGSVTLQTTQLKELRATARQQAMAAAREKAELYCQAAGVSITGVWAIEDVNPDTLTRPFTGHTRHEPELSSADDAIEFGSINPGAIAIRAAVNVIYTFSADTAIEPEA